MEPSQQTPSSARGMHTKPGQQRTIPRQDNMPDKKPLVTMPHTLHEVIVSLKFQFSASTSRAMNSRLARNRTTSESAVIHGKHAATTPLVFDQEITLEGNKLVHLPPQSQPKRLFYALSLSFYIPQRMCDSLLFGFDFHWV
ncbi:hypothetical protein COOONC_28400 [Cooperia oncophora]